MSLVPLPPSQPPALARGLNAWLASQVPATRRAYANAYVRARRFFPGVPLDQVDELLAAEVVAQLEVGYEPSTVYTTYYALRDLWGHLARHGLVADNPWAQVRIRKPKDRRAERILTEEEIRRLVDAAANRRQAAYVRFLYATGLRVAESVSVTWRDIHADGSGRHLLTVYGKGGKTRQVELPERIFALLVLLRGPGRQPAERLWPFGARRARQLLAAISRRADLGKAPSPHWLRHAHITHALRHGAPITTVQATAGHARLETTLHYVHLEPGESSSSFVP